MKLEGDLDPDDRKLDAGGIRGGSPLVSDEAGGARVIYHDVLVVPVEGFGTLVRDSICGGPLSYWDALAAVQAPFRIDDVDPFAPMGQDCVPGVASGFAQQARALGNSAVSGV